MYTECISLFSKKTNIGTQKTTTPEIVHYSMAEESFVKGLVNKILKVEIADGRILIGSLICTDSDQNIIIGGATEHWHSELSMSVC